MTDTDFVIPNFFLTTNCGIAFTDFNYSELITFRITIPDTDLFVLMNYPLT